MDCDYDPYKHPEYEIRSTTPPARQLRRCIERDAWISLAQFNETLTFGDVFVTIRDCRESENYPGCSWILTKFGTFIAANMAIRLYSEVINEQA